MSAILNGKTCKIANSRAAYLKIKSFRCTFDLFLYCVKILVIQKNNLRILPPMMHGQNCENCKNRQFLKFLSHARSVIFKILYDILPNKNLKYTKL
jgi:hypothetical protein